MLWSVFDAFATSTGSDDLVRVAGGAMVVTFHTRQDLSIGRVCCVFFKSAQVICGRAKAARLDPGPGSTRAANRLVQALTASIDVGISSSSIIHTFTIVIHTSKEVTKGTSRCCYQ